MSNKKSQTKWCLSIQKHKKQWHLKFCDVKAEYPKTGNTMATGILLCQTGIFSQQQRKKSNIYCFNFQLLFLGWWYMELVKYVIVDADLFIIYRIFCLLKSLKFLNISFWSIKSALGHFLKFQNCNVVIHLRIWNSEYFI